MVKAVQKYDRIFRINTWFRFRDGFYGMGTPVAPIRKGVFEEMPHILYAPPGTKVRIEAAGDCEFAVVVKQPLHGRRREKQWHVESLAKDRDRHVDVVDAGEHIRHEVHRIEGLGVASHRDFIIGATVDVMKDWRRQALFGELAKIAGAIAVVEAQCRMPVRDLQRL